MLKQYDDTMDYDSSLMICLSKKEITRSNNLNYDLAKIKEIIRKEINFLKWNVYEKESDNPYCLCFYVPKEEKKANEVAFQILQCDYPEIRPFICGLLTEYHTKFGAVRHSDELGYWYSIEQKMMIDPEIDDEERDIYEEYPLMNPKEADAALKEIHVERIKDPKPSAKMVAKKATPKGTEKSVAAKKPVVKAKATVLKESAETKTVKKTVTKRKATKKAVMAQTFDVFLEYNGNQINVTPDQIRARIEDIYKAEGHRVGNIKSLQVYLNLDERKAYYVINGKSEGKFVEI